MPGMPGLVTIVTLILPFAFVIVMVWLKNNEKQKRQQLQADLYVKALEKGQPVPTDLFAEDKKKDNPLNTGIILIAVSIGITVFLWLLFDSLAQKELEEAAVLRSIPLAGLIPFLAGVAFLIIHFIEKKKAANKDVQWYIACVARSAVGWPESF